MEAVAEVTDDEREDGEIVDDFEDISDYSIPSCGKSDYSRDILRAISLSSISDSDGEREYGKRHYLPPRKRHRCKNEYHRSKRKRKRGDLQGGYGSRKHRRSLSSSGTDSDVEKLDKRTLRQLKEAVRINASTELHHNSLRTRLKAMIDPNSEEEEEDIEALRTLALITKNPAPEEGSPKPEETPEAESQVDDPMYDKELAELRSEALKSAVIKNHMERKKRKELDKKDNNNEVQTKTNLNENNDKENEKQNFNNAGNVGKDEASKPKEKEVEVSIEEDVDVMRAMLLASISTKITTLKPVKNSAVTSTPNNLIKSRVALQKKQTNLKPPQPPIKLPSVKPLIIRLNSDTESDLDKSSNNAESNPINETVTKLLKKHREEFEAKEKQSEQMTNKDNNVKDLDKSVVKLLSKSQQHEYQLLKQKLLMASKRKQRRLSARVRNAKKEEVDEKCVPNNLKKTLQQLQFEKDGRLQMKGKYKELAPLIQKVNIFSEKRKRCDEYINGLLSKLRDARAELATSHQNFTDSVKKLKQAKQNIDLRLSKLAKAKTICGTKPVSTLTNIPEPAKQTEPIPLPIKTVEPVVATEVDQIHETDAPVGATIQISAEVHVENLVQNADDETVVEAIDNRQEEVEIRYSEYVSPLDRRYQKSSNPMKMFCPYELFGTCKDQDCVYNHCP